MMKKAYFGVFAAGLAGGIMMLATVNLNAAEFKLTAGSSHPPIVPWARALRDLVVPESTKRAKALGHTLKWTEAYSGSIYNFKNTLEGVQDGLADVGWVGTLWEPAKMPLHNVTYFAPFGATNVRSLMEIGRDLHAKIPAMNKHWKKHNQKLLGVFATDAYVLITKKPVGSVADLKGLKIYAPGAVSSWLKGTGAAGVNGGLPVYYNGIKTGVADGGIVPTTGILPFKLFEVAPHVTVVQLGGAIPGALTINLNTWKKLPPELQKMFMDIGREYSELVTKQVTGFYNKTMAILKKNPKVTVATLPVTEQKKWAKVVPNIAADWVKRNEADGLPAKQVLKLYMAGIRARGETPLRDWDKELP